MVDVTPGAQGTYRLYEVEGDTYVLFQQGSDVSPLADNPETRRTTVDLVTHTPNGAVLTIVGTFYGFSDAVTAAVADYQSRREAEQQDTIKRALGPTCYSDHNEDIRTKGSCDFCGGSAPNEG